MFLNRKQILERLHKGDLIIDPLRREQIQASHIDLRLGTQFQQDPSSHIITKELGEEIILRSNSMFSCMTLEYIQVPNDLLGIIFLRSALTRIGLMTNFGIVDPTYQGKLAVQLINVGNHFIMLYPGMRFLKLGLAKIEAVKVYPEKYPAPISLRLSKAYLDPEFEKLKKLISKRRKQLQTAQVSPISLRDCLSQALETKGSKKGKMLERLAVEMFRTIRGLKILDMHVRLKAEELDIVIQNNISVGFWRFAGSPIVVECKNWSGKVGAREISVLSDKLDSIGPDAKTGILIAPNGVSGDSRSDAILKIREKRQKGQYIIVLDREDLEQIANGTHASVVIERKYGELLLI